MQPTLRKLTVLASTLWAAGTGLAAAPSAAQPCGDRCSISISGTTAAPSYRIGEPLVYVLTVHNTGLQPLEAVKVSTIVERGSDKRPDAAACAAENGRWSETPGGGLWTRSVGQLYPGERRTVRFCVEVEESTSCAAALLFQTIGNYPYEYGNSGYSASTLVSAPRASCAANQCVAEAIHCLFHAEDPSCAGGVAPTPRTAIARLASGAVAAVARFFASVDDLTRLYVLRDALGAAPGGRGAIALYVAHQGELKRLLLADPVLRERAIDVLTAWRPVIDGVIGALTAPITITNAQVGDLQSFLAELRVVASPALRAAIDRESRALDLGSVAGLTADQGLQRLVKLTCIPDAGTLCLSGGRIRVETAWESRDGKRGHGRAVPLTSDTGTFWFFDAANVETLVKVVDACTFNDRRWLFAAGLTDVDVVTTVTDTTTGAVKTYRNRLGQPFAPVQDTAAFDCTP